ncbi:penicillin-binding transpeptidase domain-containing protein [Mesobacillus harenae]|uniref:penicillin-binding transpeptidase domain-containing protein n=1 Tax=Mesobacillus harenae TaxID=2213203 RepID=UPI001580BB09|nr:penicillin-binding transpeptidase domain-containing protein [Mesobacillus harenae]
MKKTILFIITLCLTVFISGCNKDPKPEERFAQYIKLWNDQNFDEMYGFLAVEAQASVTKEEFVERYNKIYQDLEIDKLDVNFIKPEEEDEPESTVDYPFSVKMESIAGPISFDHTAQLVKEEQDENGNWYLNWDTTYIFPDLEEGDKINFSTVKAERGQILDRDGNGIAINGTALNIGVVPQKMEGQEEKIISNLSELLEMSEESIQNALDADWVQPDQFVPLKKISRDDTALQEALFAMEAVTNTRAEAREYPYGEALSHLTGYVGPVTAEELEKLQGKGYSGTDLIGKRGLEQILEAQLKGQNGIKILIVKEDGTEKLLAERPVKNGESVQLTLDVVLHQKIYDQMKGMAGASAAIDPLTGETLALVSSPGFDPNAMTLGISATKRQALEEDPLQPLLNRFRATYVPGSVIKPITAAIGLESGAISMDTAYEINEKQWGLDSWGNYKITRYTNLQGQIDLEKAMIYSDNIYFARAALDIGQDDFTEGLKNFGFDEDLDFFYPIEDSQMGSIENEQNVADSAYGQAQVEMNVLHLAATYTPFVNSGNMIKPIMQIEEEKSQVWKEGLISAEHAAAINSLLTKVVTDPNGTARDAKIDGYPLAGKTGTAEIKEKQGEKGEELGWFVGYNPNTPDLLITMMLENAQTQGGSKAAVTRVTNIFR